MTKWYKDMLIVWKARVNIKDLSSKMRIPRRNETCAQGLLPELKQISEKRLYLRIKFPQIQNISRFLMNITRSFAPNKGL